MDKKAPIPETERENQIFKAALNTKQSIPSPETKQFMDKIEMKIQNIEDKLKLMPTKDEMLLANKELVEDILEKCDKKYASKLVERIIFAAGGAAGLWGLYKLLEVLAN